MQTDPNFTNFLWNSRSQQVCINYCRLDGSQSSAAAVSSGLWSDARVQERIHGQLVAPPLIRCIRGPHRMRRSEPKSWVSHWRGKSGTFISHLFPSHTPIDAPNTDHARRSHRLDDPPSDPFQIYDSTAFCVWTRDSLGGHHSSYTG